MATKTINYTDEMTTKMVELYSAQETDEARKQTVMSLAESLGKSVASIRAKLSREKVYIKAKPISKATGNVAERKIAKVNRIAELLGLESSDIKSAEKMTAIELDRIIQRLPQ